MYNAHARSIGFSVRKYVSRKTNAGELYEFYFVCSCQGFCPLDKPIKKTRRSRKKRRHMGLAEILMGDESLTGDSRRQKKKRTVNVTRCGCHAGIRFVFDEETGFFVVVDHIVEHNHEVAKPHEVHHLKSNRNIPESVGDVIISMSKAGIKPMDSYNYLCLEAGGEEVVGYTKKDHLNYLLKMKNVDVECGDMQSVLDLLHDKSMQDSAFFYRVKVDTGNRVSCIFWRDSLMLEDYKLFGDLLITDTTYRTNKYNLICAPFVGINNHWRTTMFGCAFVTNEKTDTFVWLLETFKKAMHGVEPKTIFTDQDAALAGAIHEVFPKSRHRLCLWHLQQNFVSHWGKLKEDSEFKARFDKCLMGCEDKVEFEEAWAEMVCEHSLEGNEWFDRLYSLKEKWCPALNGDMFSSGILSTQRIESTNRAISFKSSPTTSMYEFFHIFEDVLKRWRSRETEDNFKNRMERPPEARNACALVKHAASVYTLSLFKDFYYEFQTAMKSYIMPDGSQGPFTFFVVSLDPTFKRSHRVLCELNSKVFYCNCLCYEETKLLCYHSLRVMHNNNIFEIPSAYIDPRWRKDAKMAVWNDKCESEAIPAAIEKKDMLTPWRHTMGRNYYSLLSMCQTNPEARKKCEEYMYNLSKEIEVLMKADGSKTTIHFDNEESNSTRNDGDEASSSSRILDPERRAVTKGRPKNGNKRIRNKFERNKTATSRPNEYGTITPVARLF